MKNPKTRRTDRDALAVLVSDIHLSHKCPVARSNEPDWYAAMARPLVQVKRLVESLPGDPAVVCGGDIFHRWNECPELIRWAMNNLPEMYAIPGNHDLPFHQLSGTNKSAFGVLEAAGVIKNLCAHQSAFMDAIGVNVQVFPPGTPIKRTKKERGRIKLAVVHKYIWIIGKGYQGAPDQARALAMSDDLQGYDVALFGDNHQSFAIRAGDCHVVNPGCLIRRNFDERSYETRVGVLWSDGTTSMESLDCSQDVWCDPGTSALVQEISGEMREFVRSLERENETQIDFLMTIQQAVEDSSVDERTRRMVLRSIEEQQK